MLQLSHNADKALFVPIPGADDPKGLGRAAVIPRQAAALLIQRQILILRRTGIKDPFGSLKLNGQKPEAITLRKFPYKLRVHINIQPVAANHVVHEAGHRNVCLSIRIHRLQDKKLSGQQQ